MKGNWVLDYRQPTVSAVALNICFLKFLFIVFGCMGSSLLHGLFSSFRGGDTL